MHSRRIGLLVLALGGASPAMAQTVMPGPGSRIRFSRAESAGVDPATRERPREHTVTVLEARGDSVLVLPTEGARYVVALSDLQRVRLSGGRSRLAGGGAGVLWGAAVGGILGGVAGAVDAARCSPPCEEARAEELGMIGALTSVWLGALVGFAVGKETWVPINVSIGRPGAPASRPGARLGLSMSF